MLRRSRTRLVLDGDTGYVPKHDGFADPSSNARPVTQAEASSRMGLGRHGDAGPECGMTDFWLVILGYLSIFASFGAFWGLVGFWLLAWPCCFAGRYWSADFRGC